MGFFSFRKLGRTLLLSAAVVAVLVGSAAAQEDGGVDTYISPKFLYSPGLGGIYGILDETVQTMGSGVFHGFGYSVGVGKISDKDSSTTATLWFGTSFSYGYEVSLENDLQFLFGLSVGIYNGWTIEKELLPISSGYGLDATRLEINMREGFGGPFARVRWHSVELMYQMLLGPYMNLEVYDDGPGARLNGGMDMSTGFGVMHQLSLGYCFGKKQR